jgi:hypothetical protein
LPAGDGFMAELSIVAENSEAGCNEKAPFILGSLSLELDFLKCLLKKFRFADFLLGDSSLMLNTYVS